MFLSYRIFIFPFIATLDRKIPGSIPDRDLKFFLIARDKWHPGLDAICHELLKTLHAPAKDRDRDLSI